MRDRKAVTDMLNVLTSFLKQNQKADKIPGS